MPEAFAARKADIRQIDHLVRELGLTRAQRRILHDEITRRGYTLEQIRQIAEALFGRKRPKQGR